MTFLVRAANIDIVSSVIIWWISNYSILVLSEYVNRTFLVRAANMDIVSSVIIWWISNYSILVLSEDVNMKLSS